MLPDKASLQLLETRHEHYDYYKAIWQTIADLREGAPAMLGKPQDYVPKRPGEKEDVYKLRLAKFSYTPIMATAIREFTAKLSSAPVHVSGVDREDTFWAELFEALDGKNQDEAEFLNDVFSCLLYFGRVFLGVDLPKLGVQPRSRAEDPNSKPYVSIIEPLHMINWGDGWYLSRQTKTLQEPLQQPKTIARWTFWTAEEVAIYESEVKVDSSGYVSRLKSLEKWMHPAAKEASVPKVSSFLHDLGKPPVATLELPSEMWTGSQVYLKQKQHTLIENSWTDAGSIAGTIQRIFTPPPELPADDPRFTLERPDYSELKADNAHILIGSDFKFVESSGSAIAALTGQLETIEHQIKALVSMGWQSSSTTSLNQSGASKAVDHSLLQDAMRSYGKKVCQLYQDVLGIVAKLAQRTEEPNVQGLDTYAVSTLDAVLAVTLQLIQLLPYLPPTAWRIWIAKMVNLLTGAISPEDQGTIEEELLGLDPDSVALKQIERTLMANPKAEAEETA